MKKSNLLRILLFAGLGSIPLVACASKPTDELQMVSAAMDKARSDEAPEYAPYDWDRGRMYLGQAHALIQMGRYSEARDVLGLSVSNFNTGSETAKRRIESLKIEISALRSTAEEESKRLEQAATSPKVKPTLRKRVDADLPLIEEKIAAMNWAFAEKDYLQARTAGQEAVSWMRDLQSRGSGKL